MDTPQKKCSKCHKFQSLDQFDRSRNRKDGLAQHCKTCRSAYNAANKESIDLANAATYQRDREHRLEKARIRREARREEERAYQEQYRKKFPEKARAVTKRWRRNNHPRRRLIEHNREARKRELPHTWTTEQRAFMLEYWQHACAVCGNQNGLFWSLSDDHWVPFASPKCPGTVATNMIPLCIGEGGCNNSKHKSDPHTWLVRRFGQQKAATIERKIATYFALVAQTFPQLEKGA